MEECSDVSSIQFERLLAETESEDGFARIRDYEYETAIHTAKTPDDASQSLSSVVLSDWLDRVRREAQLRTRTPAAIMPWERGIKPGLLPALRMIFPSFGMQAN